MNNFDVGSFFQIIDEACYGLQWLLIPLVCMAMFGFAIFVIKEICCSVFNH